MAVRPIRRFGDPILRAPSSPVTEFDDRLRGLVDDLLDTVNQPGAAGVAAPQIGVGLRVFSYHVDDELGYVINPELVTLSEETQDGSEGCLSVPGMSFPTVRAEHATCRGVNLDNETVTVSGSGLMARCMQHEVDHLDGIVYLNRLDKPNRRDALRQVRASDWFWE